MIREMEVREFPELRDDDMFSSHWDPRYQGYTPSHHARTGLVTRTMIDDLSRRKKYMLSVGCGNSYLERIMTKMGVDPDKIVLADISSDTNPQGFRFYPFDMFGEWPPFDRRFDYIIFPESLCSLWGQIPETLDGDLADRFAARKMSHLFTEILRNLTPHGHARFDGHAGHKEVYNAALTLTKAGYPEARLYFRKGLMLLK